MSTINDLRQIIADRDAEIADLEDSQRIQVARLHSLDFCVADNIEAFEKLETEKQGLVDRIRDMQGGIDRWWDYYDWAEYEMDYLYNRKEELKDQVADMEAANVEHPEIIAGLRTQLTNLDDENSLNVEKVEALTDEVKALKKRVAELEAPQETGLPPLPLLVAR